MPASAARLALALALTLVVGAASVAAPAAPPVDAQQLAGTWFELARADDARQADCASDVVDRYRPERDGTLVLERSCRTPTGRLQTQQGRAWVDADHGDRAGWLEVSFLPRWLQWLPLRRDELHVVMLDPHRRYAVLADSGGRGLWLLARMRSLPPELLRGIVDRLTSQGYPTGALVLTPQSGADGQLGRERPFYPAHPALVVWRGPRPAALPLPALSPIAPHPYIEEPA
jgi:apolipoprotein D and lipocalin family protein